MINKYLNNHNTVKNPNWQEGGQLAIYKRSWEVELPRTTSAGGQNGIWIRDQRISNPTL